MYISRNRGLNLFQLFETERCLSQIKGIRRWMNTATTFLFRSVRLWLYEKANLCAKATNISLTKVSSNYETSIARYVILRGSHSISSPNSRIHKNHCHNYSRDGAESPKAGQNIHCIWMGLFPKFTWNVALICCSFLRFLKRVIHDTQSTSVANSSAPRLVRADWSGNITLECVSRRLSPNYTQAFLF